MLSIVIKLILFLDQCGHDPKVRIWDLTGDKTVSIELGDHKFSIDSVVCKKIFASNV